MSTSIRYPLRESPYLKNTRLPYVAFVERALPNEACAALIARIEASSPEVAPIMINGQPVMNTRVRNNERVVFDDQALAKELFVRARAFAPESLHGGTLVGFNERFRCYRYRDGQRFAPHFDGAYFRPEEPEARESSQLSVLFYLNEDFTGGATTLIDYDVILTPKKGSVLLFEHAMLHEGCAVTAGTKYVLRTDAMYRFPRAV